MKQSNEISKLDFLNTANRPMVLRLGYIEQYSRIIASENEETIAAYFRRLAKADAEKRFGKIKNPKFK